MKRHYIITSVTAVTLNLCACVGSGGKGAIRFDGLKYPVSLSPYLENDDGKSVGTVDMDKVGNLRLAFNTWGIFYSLIPLSGTLDISDAINAQIASSHGEGVASLKVVVDECLLNSLFPLNMLPFWPGCANVEVSGVIVKRRPPPSPPATGAVSLIPAGRVAGVVRSEILAALAARRIEGHGAVP
jgi:hypothetical protein